jgi:lipoprotein signal peptidase
MDRIPLPTPLRPRSDHKILDPAARRSRLDNAFFIVLSLIALVAVLSALLRKQRHPDAWRDLSLALLLAGVIGNLTDRIVHGHVTDFLLFDFGPKAPRILRPWPAFNVADSCICIAVVCFIVHTLRQKPSTTEGRGD